MNDFFNLLPSKSRAFYFALGLMSIVSSLTNLGVLSLINNTLKGNVSGLHGHYIFFAFAALLIISFASTVFFQNNMIGLTNEIIYNLEISIIQKVRNATLESFEKLGKDKVYSAISDANVLGRIPEVVIFLTNSLIAIICSLLYIFYVTPLGGCFILFLMGVLLTVYISNNKTIRKDLARVRNLQDNYYDSINDLVLGFKQMKISENRNDSFFNHFIIPNRVLSKSLSVKSSKKYVFNQLFGTYSWYALIGCIIFVMPVFFKLNYLQITIIITTILYLISPVSVFVGAIPFYTRAKISVEHLNNVEALLTKNTENKKKINDSLSFESIRFEDLKFNYHDSSFKIEIKNLWIRKNEILFIVGGNGSGKSTFINLLTGLYKPHSGNIYVNDVLFTWDEFLTFSSNMSVVFTDQYLFKKNYDQHDLSSANRKLSALKSLIDKEDELRIDPHTDFFNTKLSKGQQKRLSLLLALLEDKPIVVLDEWAAEQDHLNKGLFYKNWLKEMKDQGKTVIVISHDNEEFAHADRLLRFDSGIIY